MAPFDLGSVLVVGGSGFLGSCVVQCLLSQDYASAIVIASRNPAFKGVDKRVRCHSVDITSLESVEKLFEQTKPNVVIHTASPHHLAPANQLHAANVDGTRILLNAAKKCPETKAFIYTSTDSACHPSPFKQITEDQCKLYDEKIYENPYSRSKALADFIVLSANCTELKTAVLRVPLIYGEGDQNFFPSVVQSIKNKQHHHQMGNNEKMWEYVYVENAAYAHILAAKALLERKAGADGQAYFITDGQPMPFFDFYRKACAAAGHPVKKEDVRVTPFWVVQVMASMGEWMFWIATLGKSMGKLRRQDIDHLDKGCWWSIEKARRLLGYEVLTGMDEGLGRAAAWGMKGMK